MPLNRTLGGVLVGRLPSKLSGIVLTAEFSSAFG